MSSFVKVVKKEFQSKSEIEKEKILNPYEKRRLAKLKKSKNNN